MFRAFSAACAVTLGLLTPVFAADTPGVTATEIKVGGIFPFSGPASSIGLVGRGRRCASGGWYTKIRSAGDPQGA
jgi:hypothetical protein